MLRHIPERFVFLSIFLFCFMLYGHTLSFGITWLDDYYLLVESAPILSDISNFFKLFSSGVLLTKDSTMYRPLLNVSYMADTILNCDGFFVSHLINVLMHAAASCLVYALLREFRAGKGISAALAIVFASHPASSVAVSWIPGRNDLLLACLAFPALIFAEKYRKSGHNSHCILYGILVLLSLFTKESAVVLPFLAAGLVLLCGKRTREELRNFAVASVAPVLIWYVARSLSNVQLSIIQIGDTIRNMVYLPVLAGRAVFPVSTAASVSYTQLDFPLLFALIAVAFLAISFFLAKRTGHKEKDDISPLAMYIFGALWFFTFIIPTMAAGNGMDFGNSYFEHRLYVPLAGIMLILCRIDYIADLNKFKIAFLAIFSIYLSCASFCHSTYYESRELFWPKIAHQSPKDFSLWIWSGVFESRRMLYGAAEFYYAKSLEADPDQPMAHFLIAEAAYNKGDIDTAIKELEEELRRFPGNEDALNLMKEIGKR